MPTNVKVYAEGTRFLQGGKKRSLADKYVNQLPLFLPISKDEERLLLVKSKSSDKEESNKAINELVSRHLRFAVKMAGYYSRMSTLTFEDLIQEANVGLILAAKKFDLSKDVRFISYAKWWIRKCIQIALTTKSDLIAIPYNKKALLIQISKRMNLYILSEGKNDLDSILEKIAEDLQVALSVIKEALLNYKKEIFSLSTGFFSSEHSSQEFYSKVGENSEWDDVDEEGYYVADLDDYEEKLFQENKINKLKEVIEELPDRMKFAIKAKFGIDSTLLSLKEVSEIIHLSKQRCWQIQQDALKIIKFKMELLHGKEE